ncbi:MAG TPA: HAMP domain-containing sensor histidine kinase, partial [Ktedonosporobacter sp.]|nr:HAMP domain-containing sensor histidine kinase [Ktedonosporobacter sp.]
IILGYSELLQMSAPSDGASMQQYALNSITHECQHLLRLIGDLLDVSRLEQAQLEVQKQKHDVLMIVGNLVSTFMETTSTHKLSLRLQEIEPHEPLLGWVDLPRLEQIVSNLTTNAIKYSPGGGKVEIGVRPVRDGQGMAQEVMIWVKDEGIGIATSDLPYLFERFYRAKKIDRSISGFGIGLYLTKELVQAHGGRIWVESTKGEGSTFFVQLPLGEPQEAILARK